MVYCATCDKDVEGGRFCGECGSTLDAPAPAPAATATVPYCASCDAERPPGKFCGECGTTLSEKEVTVDKKSAGSGLSIFEQNAIASQKAASAPIKSVYSSKPSAGYCGSFGDEQRRKAQADASSTSRGTYNKFGGGAATGYVGTFGEEQRKKAQAAASNPVQKSYGGGAGTGYVGSFGDEQRRKAQAAASTTGGYNKFSGQKPVGGGMDMVTAHNVAKQKETSEAFRTKDNIVLSTEKKTETGMDFVTAHNVAKQKETSEAFRTKDKIIVSTEKKCEDSIDMQTASALRQQKETSSALRQQDKMIKTSEGTGEGPKWEAKESPEYRCDSCDAPRPEGKFCQDCGSRLTAV